MIVKVCYIKVLQTVPERREQILTDDTGQPGEFETEQEAEQYMHDNKDSLDKNAYYTIISSYKVVG